MRLPKNKNFKDKKGFKYPSEIPFAETTQMWSKSRIENFLAPFFAWAAREVIPTNRLVAGEFGCHRRNLGCHEYLADLIDVLNKKKIHWAFYSFREYEWDGYDYEVGEGGLGWKYRQALGAGEKPEIPRKNNPLFEVIRREFFWGTTFQEKLARVSLTTGLT